MVFFIYFLFQKQNWSREKTSSVAKWSALCSVMWKASCDISRHDQMHQSIPSATAQQVILLNCITDHSLLSFSLSFGTFAVKRRLLYEAAEHL